MTDRHLELVARRWPRVAAWLDAAPPAGLDIIEDVPEPALVVEGIQLGSAYAPIDEAELQSLLIPDDAERATVYGLGQGHLVATLLTREVLRELRVVLLSAPATASVLTLFELGDWLEDPRLELCVPTKDASLETPFAVVPSELRLADPVAWRLRDMIQLELVTPFLNRAVDEATESARENVERNKDLFDVDGDVAELFGSRPGATIRVAATGPSLSEHYETLRAGGVPLIAVDSALPPLVQAGVVPDVVVSTDVAEISVSRFLDVSPESARHATLVYFPASPHEAIRSWPGRRLAAYPEGTRFEEHRRLAERGSLFASGSVVHAAVDLAVRMGAARVELYGADFATPGGQTHVAELDTSWISQKIHEPLRPLVEDGNGQAIQSMRNLLGYLRDLEAYVERHPDVDFVNASRSGARIRGVRYAEDEHAA